MPSEQQVALIYAELQLKTAQFKAALGEATAETRRFSAQMKAEMHESKAAIALVGETIGVSPIQSKPQKGSTNVPQ